MHGKRACLVADLRAGNDVVKIPDLIAVLDAAGWKTDISLKEYGGESLKLAEKAAKDGYDLVIGYGGDGTLNDVVNGVMFAGGKSIIGDIPGGTFNEWAGEIDLPGDAMKAALDLVNSYVCDVDLGFFEVEGLTLLAHNGANGSDADEQGEEVHEKPKKAGKRRQYFLLHAGLGADAAIMAHINKPLKYHVGPLAFDLSGIKELPQQRPFPVEIRALNDSGNAEMLWQGDAWQLIVNNTRRYAGSIDISPDAYLDDGLIDVTVITSGGGLTTIQEAVDYLLLRKVDKNATQSFRGAHLSISVPATILMELDGSVVKLDDYLRKGERKALQQAQDASTVMVHYRFDAVPASVRMAIPRSYDGAMFEKPAHKKQFEKAARQHRQDEEKIAELEHRQSEQHSQQEQPLSSQKVEALQKQGQTVRVAGVGPDPNQKDAFIIAGTYQHKNDDKLEPAVVCVDQHTLVLNQQGEQVAPLLVETLPEGKPINVEGKRNKRGVIHADYVMMP